MEYRFTCLNCGTHEEPIGVDLPEVCPEVLYWVCRYCGVAWTCLNLGPRLQDLAQAMVDSHNNDRQKI